jgi:hypothetical protein
MKQTFAVLLLAGHAGAQVASEIIAPTSPAAGDLFGRAVKAGDLINGPNGSLQWAIVGSPGRDVGGLADAGRVECVPPPGATPRILLTLPPGHAQAGASFGEALAVDDIDGDGTVDVAVGAPGYDAGAVADAGRVYVFFGPWTPGAATPYANWCYLVVPPIDASIPPEPGGRFGSSLAIGNLNQAAGRDLVVGAPRATDIGVGRLADAGAFDIFLDPVGNGGVAQIIRNQHRYIDPAFRAGGNQFGAAVGIGQFARSNGASNQTWPDVVIGASGWDGPGNNIDTGRVQFYYGHTVAGQPVWGDSQALYRQSFPGPFAAVGGTSDQRFGATIAPRNYDGGAWDEVAVAGLGGGTNGPAGYVALLRGATQGVTFSVIPPDMQIVPGAPGLGHQFGIGLDWAARDNNPIYADLMVGFVHSNPAIVGKVYTYAGQPLPALLSNWPLFETITDPGIAGPLPLFGYALTASRRNGPGLLSDLMVGVPGANSAGVASGLVLAYNQ